MSSPADDDRVPVLTPVGDALEGLVFGRYAAWYRWLVRAVAALVVVALVVQAARVLGGVGLSAGAIQTLNRLTALVVTLFVLAGVVELLLFARGVRRRRAELADSAETVERAAETVERAAGEVSEAADELPAEEVETPVEDAEAQAERAVERAEDARETTEEVRDDLEPDEP